MMIEVEEFPHDRHLLQRAACGDVTAAADLYDRYGAAMYAFALMVTGRRSVAEAAVVRAFREAGASATPGGERAWRVLARATLAACPVVDGGRMRTRCLVALTLLGGHQLNEAAAALGIDQHEAAVLLLESLRDRARTLPAS